MPNHLSAQRLDLHLHRVMEAFVDEPDRRRRHRRFPVRGLRAEAHLHYLGGRAFEVTVEDLSFTGVGFTASVVLAKGITVELMLDAGDAASLDVRPSLDALRRLRCEIVRVDPAGAGRVRMGARFVPIVDA